MFSFGKFRINKVYIYLYTCNFSKLNTFFRVNVYIKQIYRFFIDTKLHKYIINSINYNIIYSNVSIILFRVLFLT